MRIANSVHNPNAKYARMVIYPVITKAKVASIFAISAMLSIVIIVRINFIGVTGVN